MKNYIRFISLIMAIAMMFSFSTVAFAAENEENINFAIVEAFAAQKNTETMSEISPRDVLTEIYTGHTRTTYTIPVTVSIDRYLYWVVSSSGPITLTMYKDGVQVGRGVYSDKTGEGVWVPILKTNSLVDNCWDPGQYTIEVKVLFDASYAFQIRTTKEQR